MKKVIALVLAVCMALAMANIAYAQAADGTRWGDSGAPQDSGIIVTPSDGRDIELKGDIEPTIISVVVPSYVPFSISKSLSTENKVLSPKIGITNNSGVPVNVYVDNTKIDLSELPYTYWETSSYVGYYGLAIGMVQSYSPPSHLYNVQWLPEGKQHTNVLSYLYPGNTQNLYLAGTLGDGVPENRSFSVTATLVVKPV